MQYCYIDSEHHATVYLMPAKYHRDDSDRYILTSWEINRKFRGKGYASKLFDEVLAEADKENVTLLLSVEPDGTGLDSTALFAFYASRGFEVMQETTMIRYPKVKGKQMNVITKSSFAPARLPIPERLREVVEGKFKVAEGAQGKSGLMNEKQACIMELTAYILGYDDINDSPPCTSATIRDFMIEINDNVSDRRRAQLKKVIPDVINTAPIYYRSKTAFARPLTRTGDREYKAAEKQRQQMIDEFLKTHGKQDKYGDLEDNRHIFKRISMPKLTEFIRELANVAHFDAPPHPADNPATMENTVATNGSNS